MANTVTAFEQGTMEENQGNQFNFGEVVNDSSPPPQQQQQPCSTSAIASEMKFTDDDELNDFLAGNTAVEFEFDDKK